MTATLTFTLPDEQDAFKTSASAAGWRDSLEELDNWLSEKIKDGHDFKTAIEAIEMTRKKLYTIAIENQVRLFDH